MTPLRRASLASRAMLAAAPLLVAAGIALLAVGPQLPAAGQYLALVVACYLFGSLSWGYMLVNLTMGEDIRDFGSGRTGMSNILRTAGGKAATLVFVLDAGKAIVAVLLARQVIGAGAAEAAAALAVLCGHNWPVFLRFRGGRGIMPGLGGMSVMAPWVTLAGCGLFLVVTLSSRYLSLGSITGTAAVAIISLALTLLAQQPEIYTLYACVGGAVIIWQHRDNIRRIINGTERRVGMPGLRNR